VSYYIPKLLDEKREREREREREGIRIFDIADVFFSASLNR
jgi:hypothetical protein